ncbi:MAG: hypothetical protein V4721_10360 [Bacteroidota bacterium]
MKNQSISTLKERIAASKTIILLEKATLEALQNQLREAEGHTPGKIDMLFCRTIDIDTVGRRNQPLKK